MIDPTEHSVSYILDWIRESRKAPHPKAPAGGGYEPTHEGMSKWVNDVMFLLGYVADKDIDRYERFLQDTKGRDPAGFNALVGSMYHTEPQQVEDVTALVPTTTVPDVTPPPTTTIPVPTTTPPPTTTPGVPPHQPPTSRPPWDSPFPWAPPAGPPTLPSFREPDRRGDWTWPPPPKGVETRPHSPHAPFWPRVPSDWPYARGPEYGEIPEGDATLNAGPDNWGAPPGTPAARPSGDAQPTGASLGLPEEGPIPAIVGALQGGVEQAAGSIKDFWDVVVRQEWPNTGLRPLDDFMNDITSGTSEVRQG